MSKKTLIWIIIGWVFLKLLNYYYVPYFILALELLVLDLTLFILVIIHSVKLVKERKAIKKLRIHKVLLYTTLFLLMFFNYETNYFIEKVDWVVFYNKRSDIVEQIKLKKINPNVSWNDGLCELPFDFPVVSNGGNDIWIDRNKDNGDITVTFWIFRNFFSAPSTQFIYTNDPKSISDIKERILKNPLDNWKINENWYRTFGR